MAKIVVADDDVDVRMLVALKLRRTARVDPELPLRLGDIAVDFSGLRRAGTRQRQRREE